MTTRWSRVWLSLAVAVPMVVAPSVAMAATAPNSPADPLAAPSAGMLDLGGCSGAIVRFPSSVASDPAVLLTAAHCVGRPDGSSAVMTDAAPAQGNPVHLLDRTGGVLTTLSLDRVEYAGNWKATGGIDLGVIRLSATYASLQQQYGVQPPTVATGPGGIGDSLRIVSGAWKQQTHCVETRADLHGSDPYGIQFQTGPADPCAGIVGGWSGSPVIRVADGTVVAAMGVTVSVGDGAANFDAGAPAALLTSCLTADRSVDPRVAGCALEPGLGTGTGTVVTGGTQVAAPGGTCLDVAGDDVGVNGAPVQVWACQSGARDQHWSTDGSTLRTLGRCLDVAGDSTATGSLVELWDCDGVGGQQWTQRADGSLLNPASGKCLDVPAGNTANGTRLQLWDCNGTTAQVFRIA